MAARPTATSRPTAVDRPRTALWRCKDDGHSTAGGGVEVGGGAALTPPPAGGVLASDPPLATGCSAREDGTQGAGRRRRRRRRVRRQHAAGQVEDGHPPAASFDHSPVPAPAACCAGVVCTDAVPRLRRIIDRSERIARAEDELRCTLSILVVGDPTAFSVDGLGG